MGLINLAGLLNRKNMNKNIADLVKNRQIFVFFKEGRNNTFNA